MSKSLNKSCLFSHHFLRSLHSDAIHQSNSIKTKINKLKNKTEHVKCHLTNQHTWTTTHIWNCNFIHHSWIQWPQIRNSIRVLIWGFLTENMNVDRSSLCNCVVNFLLEENYVLTAFELLHELLDDGHDDQAIRLKQYFSDQSLFPADQISRLNSLRGNDSPLNFSLFQSTLDNLIEMNTNHAY